MAFSSVGRGPGARAGVRLANVFSLEPLAYRGPGRPAGSLASWLSTRGRPRPTRSGVDLGRIDRLIEMGIISPDSTDRLTKGDVPLLAQMVQTLENAGIALESLAAGIQGGRGDLGFMDAPTTRRFATLSDETFEGLSRRTGLPLNLLMLIREATEEPPAPNDRVREDELAVVQFIEIELAMGFRPVSIERTLGAGRQLARRSSGVGMLAVRHDGAHACRGRYGHRTRRDRLFPADGDAGRGHRRGGGALALWHAQRLQSWTANIIGGFEKDLTDAGLFEDLSPTASHLLFSTSPVTPVSHTSVATRPRPT